MCLTCPMAKFTKLPYDLNKKIEHTPFALTHIDVWGQLQGDYKEKV